MLNDFNKTIFANFFVNSSPIFNVNRIYTRNSGFLINGDRILQYQVSQYSPDSSASSLQNNIANIIYFIPRCNLVTSNLAIYYGNKHNISLSASREIVIKILTKVFNKYLELFESEIEKRVFVTIFRRVLGFTFSDFQNKAINKLIADSFGVNRDSLISSLAVTTAYNQRHYVDLPINSSTKKAGRTALRMASLRLNRSFYYDNIIICQNIIFYKKNDSYVILAVLYLDESKVNISTGFETKEEILNFYLKQELPANWFKVFIDRDVLLNPPENCTTLIRNLKKEILEFKGEVVLGDGRKEFVNNFMISKLKSFKTLAEKLEFSKKIIDEITEVVSTPGEYEHLKLENTLKVLEKYNADVEKVITDNKKIKEEPKIVVESIVPDNLDELMAFAELISFEPNEQPVPLREEDLEDLESEDEDDDEDNDVSSDSPVPIDFYEPANPGYTLEQAIERFQEVINDGIQGAMTDQTQPPFVISRPGLPITPETIRETLNDLTRNDNS